MSGPTPRNVNASFASYGPTAVDDCSRSRLFLLDAKRRAGADGFSLEPFPRRPLARRAPSFSTPDRQVCEVVDQPTPGVADEVEDRLAGRCVVTGYVGNGGDGDATVWKLHDRSDLEQTR